MSGLIISSGAKRSPAFHADLKTHACVTQRSNETKFAVIPRPCCFPTAVSKFGVLGTAVHITYFL